MKIAILLGAIRKGRESDKVAYYLQKRLEEQGVATDLIDLMQHPLPVFQGWSVYSEETEGTIRSISARLKQADALLFVTPEYHGSFSGALKNALDFFWSEFENKPIGVAATSTGRMGGINASSQLQHVILSLGAYPLPRKLLVAEIHKAFDDDLHPLSETIAKTADTFLGEFLWFAQAITEKKKAALQLS